jgi:hypothetical protein
MIDIKDKLTQMYANDVTRKFIMHLIRSYYPSNKVQKLTRDLLDEFKPYTSNNHVKCCISGMPLVCVEGSEQANMEQFNHVALIGKGTKALMSFYVYEQFIQWLHCIVADNDKYITNIINEEMYNEIREMPEGDFLYQRLNETSIKNND